MRFEVNTDVHKFSDISYWGFLLIIIGGFILLINISINLRKISMNYEIDYLCKIILVDKNSSNIKQLYSLTGLKNKQQIREFCQVFEK